MTEAERVLVRRAKAGEWNAWLDIDAVEACHRESLPREPSEIGGCQ